MVGSKGIAIIVLLNVVFFTLVSASCPPPKAPIKTPPSPAKTPPAPKKPAKCPKDTLKFGVCADWLGLVREILGAQPSKECCALIKDLADFEAAVCLCTVLKAPVVSGMINIQIPVALSMVINSCGKKVPEGFQCP